MNKILYSIVFFLLLTPGIKAQQQLFLGIQSGWGVGLTSTENKGKVLKSKSIPWQINTGLSVQYRLFNSFSLEGGVSIDNFIWKVHDKDFRARYDKRFEVNMKNKIGSPSFFANIQYAFKLPETDFRTDNYIYVQLGGGYHKYGTQLLTQEKSLTIDGSIAETATMQTQYTEGAYFISPEIGYQKLNKNNLMSVGLVGAFNMKNNMFTSNYITRKTDGSYVASDKLTATGSYIGVNLKFNISVMYKEKKEREVKVKTPKVKKEKKKEEQVTEKEKPVIKPKVDTKPKKPAADTSKKAVNGREYSVANKVIVKSRSIKIMVWDKEQVDGDKINLSLNGNWILENYTLTKKKKIIEVELKDGVNHLVLYALNLGDIPPNTAALIVNDNNTLQEIVLESTLENSGALELIYNP